MKKILAAVALLAIVALVGCQDTKKVTELQGQLDQKTQQITELEGQVATITAERDSLQTVISDMMAKTPAKPPRTGSGTKQPGGTTQPAGKPPRTGR